MEAMMTAQQGMTPFFHYNLESNPENRQQGYFTSHPGHVQHHRLIMFPVVPTLPSTPMYSRPSSSSSQPQMPYTAMPSLPSTLTSMASPQPIAHKPTMMALQTDLGEAHGSYYPSTPPLSSSGSVISSPGDMLQTPLNPMFSGLDGVERKQVCDVMNDQVENYAHLDWSSCASPPMTPVYLPSQTRGPKHLSLNGNASDLLSTASCPSLSPSPSPYARSVSSDDVDFCDPRNLTVGTANQTLAPDFSSLTTLCDGDDEDHFDLGGEAFTKATAPSLHPLTSFEFNPQLPDSLPSFEDLSDLESEDDFVNGLVNLGEVPASTHISRSRASSDALSLCQSGYISEDELDGSDDSKSLAGCMPSPPDSCEDEEDAHKNKRQKKSEDESKPVMNTAADSQSGSTEQQSPSNQASNDADTKHNSESNSASENAGSAPAPTPANRRGRKQSLTEDPSKTFKCDLCHRRFRRQEHLKRHYRSLHTQDKPFECNECGKKFSRSDNLSQHARTHGSGAIVMGVIDDPEAMAAAMHHQGYGHHPMMGGPMVTGREEYHHTLGKVLFQVAAEIPGSESDDGSDDGNRRLE
ncbi:hypothetical protein B0H66DRAFT_597943 [Apodospora peruviana]|uniref:C2H2-type transcription factor MSN2 n=1 Tax=Apodospora peruviana TaxID=516989 RepID=A0AAE0MF94_9PEZI|nr:hypothetical protein B0H66DRAFT_597943 [Apodospora peruviana]